jgi:hypothetical protein
MRNIPIGATADQFRLTSGAVLSPEDFDRPEYYNQNREEVSIEITTP